MGIRQDIDALLPSLDVVEDALSTGNRAPFPAPLGHAVTLLDEVPNGPSCEVQSGGTNLGTKLVQTAPTGTIGKSCTYAAVLQARNRQRHQRRPDLYAKIVRLLAEGLPSPEVCKKLKIYKSLEQYHREEALSKKHIRKRDGQKKDSRPIFYEKGINYHDFERQARRGVRYPLIVPNPARVHAPGGSAIRFDSIKIGELHTVKTEAGMITLFPEDTKGNNYTTELPIPDSLLGYEGGRATLHCHWGKVSSLAISPPEVRIGIGGLESTPPEAMFKGIVGYITDLLEQGGWRFYSPPTVPAVLHYAFPMREVYRRLPELAETVPTLRVGDSEEELVLFQDWSHGTNELETTDHRMAQDIMALLEVDQ